MSLKRPSSSDDPTTNDAAQTAKKTKMQTEPDYIDENLHSRQLAVYGREAFRKFQTASVLVAGMNALGVEVGARTGRRRAEAWEARSRRGGGWEAEGRGAGAAGFGAAIAPDHTGRARCSPLLSPLSLSPAPC